MIGRDCDSSPIEFRTWIVDSTPDYDGYYYIGLRGGTNDFVDVVAYPLAIDGYFDFCFPNTLSWKTTYATLPASIYDSHLAILDGYVYLFGGNRASNIYRAPLGRPVDWEYTGSYLPTPLCGAQLAVIGNRVYLFGGNDGYATRTIYSAATNNPLVWTNHGSLLPTNLYHSNLYISDGYIYLVGGQGINSSTNVILSAQTSDPLTWTTSAYTLPSNICGSQIAMIDGYVYLFGGLINDIPTANIYRASTTSFAGWSLVGNLPKAISFSQFVTIGRKGYLFAIDVETPQTYYTKIFRCDLDDPLTWTLMSETINGEFYQSQLAVINDRLFLFGGNGMTAIFVTDQILKFSLTSQDVVDYEYVTRELFRATVDKLDLMSVLGFPDWRTNYS